MININHLKIKSVNIRDLALTKNKHGNTTVNGFGISCCACLVAV